MGLRARTAGISAKTENPKTKRSFFSKNQKYYG